MDDYVVEPLSVDTWDAFARLVERHNGVWVLVVDVRQFPRRAVLGPGDCLVAVEDQGGVRPILLDQGVRGDPRQAA